MQGRTATRRSQGERRAAMRARLLDATVESLVEVGHAQTTTVEVQRRAGVSRGTLLHYFPSRAELLFAAVEHLVVSQRQHLYLRLGLAGGPERLGAAVEALWESFQSPLATANDELWSAARTDPELRRVLMRGDRAINREVREFCANLFGPVYSSHPNYELALSTLLDAMHGARRAHVVRSSSVNQRRLASWKRLAQLLLAPVGEPDPACREEFRHD
ncbi:TetR/AcrR family transcriptional regulator [Prauserella sp. PE36]|nr:TetR/AcrR family transcriptional regulator [Prauserella sp. PE36]